jgi:hypothetical protein
MTSGCMILHNETEMASGCMILHNEILHCFCYLPNIISLVMWIVWRERELYLAFGVGKPGGKRQI